MTLWTFGGSYRVVDNGTATMDVLAGGRLWSLDSDLTLTGPRDVRQASGSQTWVDPLIGVAGSVGLGNGFGLYAEADVGGFSSAPTSIGKCRARFNTSTTTGSRWRRATATLP